MIINNGKLLLVQTKGWRQRRRRRVSTPAERSRRRGRVPKRAKGPLSAERPGARQPFTRLGLYSVFEFDTRFAVRV